MRSYIPSPTIKPEGDTPFVRVTVATNVCSDEAYTLAFLNDRYSAAITLYLSDEECDFLVEQLASARAERLQQQEKAYEVLQAKFGGPFDNGPAEEKDLCGTTFDPIDICGCSTCAARRGE